MEAIGESDEELAGKEPTKFFRVIDDETQIEITKEEYMYQKELYTGAGKEDLQWKKLSGFLEGGETFESLFERTYRSEEQVCEASKGVTLQ